MHAQRTLPPGRIGLLFALEPVFALAFALALRGERFVARWWAGRRSSFFGGLGGVERGAAERGHDSDSHCLKRAMMRGSRRKIVARVPGLSESATREARMSVAS